MPYWSPQLELSKLLEEETVKNKEDVKSGKDMSKILLDAGYNNCNI